MLFKVRVPQFKFTAIQPGSSPLPDAVPVSALQPKFSEGFRERAETVEVNGKPEVHKRRQKVSRRLEGRAVMREWLVVEAGSEGEAHALFAKAVGFATNKGITKQPEKGYEVLPYEPEGELVGAGVGVTSGTEAKPAGRKKRTAEEALREIAGPSPG